MLNLVIIILLSQRQALGLLNVHPSPSGTIPSPDYSATVDTIQAMVFFTSREGMQPVVPGDNVPTLNARNVSFFGFSTDSAVRVRVTALYSARVDKVEVYPLRAAALLPPPTISNNSISLSMDGPRQICLIINSLTDAPLCIFADPLESFVPTPSTPGVIYFGPGTHDAGVISVASGETVYLSPGAHVNGRIELTSDGGACSRLGKGVAVRGRGVLDGHAYPINATGPSLVSLGCEGALLEGITMINSPKYHLDAGYPYTNVQWVKGISWGYSTDGFTGGSQSLIQHSFLKVNDDSLKPFGPGTYVSDVVIWQMENGCAVMGSWNLNSDSGFITVRALDVIRHERNYADYNPDALLCFMHGGSGNLSNYLFEDVRVDQPGWAALQVFIQPNPWAHPVGSPGSIRPAVIVRNFSSTGHFLAPQAVQLQGLNVSSTVSGVFLDAVTFDGRLASAADVSITGNPSFASSPVFCVNCTLSIVDVDWTKEQKCSLPTSYCKP